MDSNQIFNKIGLKSLGNLSFEQNQKSYIRFSQDRLWLGKSNQ